MSRKIFVSAGHSTNPKKDRGASGNGYVEGLLTAELRQIVVEELKKLGAQYVVDVDDSILSETIAKFKNLTSSNSIVFDIHFNSAGPDAKGVETFVPNNPSKFEVEISEKLSKTVAGILQTSIRGDYKGSKGVKTESESARKQLGWMRLTGENVLIEICFISNKTEMARYQEKKYEIGKAIARILYDYSKDDLSDSKPSSNENVTKPSTHKVVSGDTLSKLSLKYGVSVLELMKLNNKPNTIIYIGEVLKLK